MTQEQQGRSSCRIYQADGDLRVIRSAGGGDSTELETAVPGRANDVPVTSIMTRDVICAQRTLGVDKLVTLVVRNHIGCIPVVDERGKPIGMVTKLDLVERMLASSKQAAPETAEDLMMPLALTLNERATVAQATAMMAVEDVHHIPVVSAAGAIMGIVSSLDIVRWLARSEDRASTSG